MIKNETRQRHAQICKVLWEVWDPIGVNYCPDAADEYDSYAGEIFTLLERNAADVEIAQQLQYIETVTMGLSVGGSSEEHLRKVIGALRAIDTEKP